MLTMQKQGDRLVFDNAGTVRLPQVTPTMYPEHADLIGQLRQAGRARYGLEWPRTRKAATGLGDE